MSPEAILKERREGQITKADLKEVQEHIEKLLDDCAESIRKESQNGRNGFKVHKGILDEHAESIASLKITSDQHAALVAAMANQISLLNTSNEHQMMHWQQVIGYTTAISGSTEANNKLIQSLIDRFDESEKSKGKSLSSRSGFWSSVVGLPAIAWPVIGIVIIAFISAFTGHMSEFIGWLMTRKIFGGG